VFSLTHSTAKLLTRDEARQIAAKLDVQQTDYTFV
jgi:hypothetical protein